MDSGSARELNESSQMFNSNLRLKAILQETEAIEAEINKKKKKLFQKSMDSDDSDPDESISKYGEKAPIVKLVEKRTQGVSFGCISIADSPGRVLVRGPALKRPLARINNFIYYESLKRGIANCGIEELNMLQRAVNPHFLRGDDCFVIGARGCGKSLSYLVPMVGELISGFEDDSSRSRSRELQGKKKQYMLSEVEGPVALIICNEFKSAIKLEGHIQSLLAASNTRKLNCGLISDNRRETRQKLEQGVEIIVTTINFAAEMFERRNSYFSLDRLSYLVFDDLDILLRCFPKPFKEVQEVADNFLLKHPARNPYQRVYCGREWTSLVEKLYLELVAFPENGEDALPIVHINSPNQAIKYSKVKWIIHDVSEKEKIRKLVDLINSLELYQYKNIFILCSCPEKARFVNFELEKYKINTLLVEMENMSPDDFESVIGRWEGFPHDRRIMVLHDSVLRGLAIHNVTCLMHYDLPMKTAYVKSAAGADRFSCMWGHFRDISIEKLDSNIMYQRLELQSHFFLTGDEDELYKLKKFALKMGCQMPERLGKIADEIGEKEMQKRPLCQGIKLYGRCMDPVPESCPARHNFLLKELEKLPPVPRICEIEVKITHCENPSLYVGQLLRCQEYKDKKKKVNSSFISTFHSTNKSLANYFENEENKMSPDPFKPGTLCAVQLSDTEFTRARIEKVMTRTANNFPKTLRVFCVDSGEYLQPTAENIFKIPPEFEQLPELAVEIVLANLSPPNGETDYRPNSIKMAKKLTQDKILIGKVNFAVGSTLWVNPLIDNVVDPSTKESVERSSIRKELRSQYLAEVNEGHIDNIISLCKQTGFTCTEFEEMEENPALDSKFMSSFFQLHDEIRWAFLSTSRAENPEFVEIWSTFTKDPYNIFGTHEKFDEQLDNVIIDLNFSITEMISNRCAKYATQFAKLYTVGLVVAVQDRLDEDKKWHRAIITQKYEEGDECLFDVFLVDIGDQQFRTTTQELFPIPRALVTRLPFQAIAFELAYIEPCHALDNQEWNEDAIHELLNVTLDKNGDSVKLEVVAIQSKKHPTFPCRYYSAVMLQETGEDLSAFLVNKNVAAYKANGQETVNLVKSKLLAKYNQLYDAQADDDDEEVEDNFGAEGGSGAPRDDSDDSDEFEIVGFNNQLDFEEFLGIPKLNGIIKPSSLVSVEEETSQDSGHRSIASSDLTNSRDVASGSNSSQIPQNSEKPVLPLFSEILHPTVYWKQTTTALILKVDHPDIKKYTLDIDGKKVSFRTQDPPRYGFDLEFHGRLESLADVVCTGQELKIFLKKRTIWKWPKPLQDNVKYRWFKEDYSNQRSSDEEEEEQRPPKPPRKILPCNLPVTLDYKNVDSDTDDSDDDDDPEGTETIGA